MSTKQSRVLKILLSFFVINSLFLFIYFHFHSSSPPDPPAHLPANALSLVGSHQTHQKPWPILPSYLPWSPPQKDVPPRSCEGYFGNGFTHRVDILPAVPGGGSWFRCFFSETLRSSICEGGNVKMVPDLIEMSRGGEGLGEVMGRVEDEELPLFQEGAFEVAEEKLGLGFKRGGGRNSRRRLVSEEVLDRYVPAGDIEKHTMRDLMASIRAVDHKDFVCEEWVEEPTLLITRFEYANLFHTITDWYSAYVSSRVTSLPNRPHVVFVDGHCTTQLEEMWTSVFSGIQYAKNFTVPVCFKHAILSPLGYETALFKGLSEDVNCDGTSAQELWRNPDDGRTARLSEFGEMIRSSFGLPVNRHRGEKLDSGHNVLFVRREDYLAHPRHGGKVESRLSNEQEVFESLQKWLASNSTNLGCKINLINGLFAHMSMKDQVRAIQDASVIIGAHGAGLTHIVSATPKTVILEIISSQFRRPHFALIARWKGLEYHAINLAGSHAHPPIVIDQLNNIMKSLGC